MTSCYDISKLIILCLNYIEILNQSLIGRLCQISLPQVDDTSMSLGNLLFPSNICSLSLSQVFWQRQFTKFSSQIHAICLEELLNLCSLFCLTCSIEAFNGLILISSNTSNLSANSGLLCIISTFIQCLYTLCKTSNCSLIFTLIKLINSSLFKLCLLSIDINTNCLRSSLQCWCIKEVSQIVLFCGSQISIQLCELRCQLLTDNIISLCDTISLLCCLINSLSLIILSEISLNILIICQCQLFCSNLLLCLSNRCSYILLEGIKILISISMNKRSHFGFLCLCISLEFRKLSAIIIIQSLSCSLVKQLCVFSILNLVKNLSIKINHQINLISSKCCNLINNILNICKCRSYHLLVINNLIQLCLTVCYALGKTLSELSCI